MNNFKFIWAGIIIAIAMSGFALVGDNQSGIFGAEGDTNYTNVVTDGYVKVGTYLSTTGASSKFGKANTYNPIYIGAGDGCTAILYAASNTLVSSATSTSFCN